MTRSTAQLKAEHAVKMRLAPHPDDPARGITVSFAELEGFREVLGDEAITVKKAWEDCFLVEIQVPFVALAVRNVEGKP